MPVSTNQVFLSKIVVYFIYELKRSLYFFVPVFLAYGLVSGLPIYFYFWLVACWLMLSLLNVAIASLFSIVAMVISMFLKNFPLIKYVLFLGIVGGIVWGIVEVIQMIPANINIAGSWGIIFWEIQDFLEMFTTKFKMFDHLTHMVIGGHIGLQPKLFSTSTLWEVLAVIGIAAVMFALAFLISRPLFFKMAAKPFEYKKITREGKKKNARTNSFLSTVKNQSRLILRTSSDAFSLLGSAIALPILILLLNKIFAAMSTRLIGDHMTVSFNLLIILMVSMATNGKIASIFSREGAAAYLNKTRPMHHRKNLLAKLVPNAVVMTLSIVASVVVFGEFTNLGKKNIVLFALTAIMTYLMHLLWSAEMDIMNPQSAVYATTGEHPNNPNETSSSVVMFFMSFALCGISLFLASENVNTAWIKVAGITLALFVFRIWSILSKIKYYYKEK